MMRNKVLREDDIQKLHTTAPEQLTDQELLLSTISAADLARKHSGGWDKEHPKCLFCGKAYRFRTFTAQCHMTSQVTGSGKHKREAAVCSMESTKDDSPLKSRFFAVRKEVYKRFKDKQQTEQQAASAALKRSMSERERDSEVIDVDNDITAPGASKQTNRTVTDRLIKKPSHEDFVVAWSEAVLGKGLTFDFFSDPLVRKAILVTAQCADSIITSSSTHGKDTVLPRRKTWTAKNLPATDDRLQQEAMRVLIPLYKEIGACFMGDGWQSTSNRPILNILEASDGFINVRRAFDASGQDKNMPFIANSMVAEMRTLGQENCRMQHDDAARKDLFQVMEAFSKVKDADGKMVGPAFKTMKSEFVAWQEAISAKKYDLHDEPEGAFTQRNMNRSQQSWVKTFMQDVMDEKGQVLFDNLAWFAKKLCSVMTSASACEHMWSIAGWIHNKRRNRLAQPNVEKAVRAHGNLVLRKAMLLSREQKVAWDSQTRISEPDRHTNEQGVDDADDDDIDC